MSKTYIIAAVSEKVKNWESAYGPMVTYYVRLHGEGDEAIQLNKKSDSPAPSEGDELYGEIQETKFGPKFKSQSKFGDSSKETSFKADPVKQDNIHKSVALEQAVNFAVGFPKDGVDVIVLAQQFYEWLAGKPKSESTRQWDSLGKDKNKEVDIEDESIDLKDIPF